MRSSAGLKSVLDKILESVGSAFNSPLCKLAVELDLSSSLIRTQEVSSLACLKADILAQFVLQSAAANWLADILQHTYDDALCVKGIDGGADGVILNAGMLRGDSKYGPGQYHQASKYGIL